MKRLITILSILFVSMIVYTQNSFAAVPPTEPASDQISYEYKIELADVGEIKSTAATKWGAYEVAAEECFDRRLSMYESQRGTASEERKLDFMDSCVNMN